MFPAILGLHFIVASPVFYGGSWHSFENGSVSEIVRFLAGART
jgi:hypothetical protein